MKTTTLIAILIPVSIFATAGALVYAFRGDPTLAAMAAGGGYVCTFVLGLVMGAK